MAEKKERRNTFLQGFGKATIGICGIVALLSSFLCSVCPLINPSTFVWTAFFGLAFWMIFFANILILIILIFLKSRRTLLIPIVALLFSIPGIIKSYSFGESKDDIGSITVMTYNVGVFRDYKVKERSVADVKKSLVKLVKEQNPDVLCLQESGKWQNNKAIEFSKNIGYKYHSVNGTSGNSYFSKYPIENVNTFKDERLSKYIDIKKYVVRMKLKELDKRFKNKKDLRNRGLCTHTVCCQKV